MLPVRIHLGWDGVTFALDPLTRIDIEEKYPGAHRATRIFLGTHEANPKDLETIGGIGDDPNGKLKIIVEMLTGGNVSELLPLRFFQYPDEEVGRVEA